MDHPQHTPTDEITRGVIATLARCLGEDARTINAETRLVADLKLDSLDVMEVVMTLEDDFECEIPDATLEGLDGQDMTVLQLACVVDRHVARSVAP